MEIRDLYAFILAVVMIGMLVAFAVIFFDTLAGTSGLSVTAVTAINATRSAITPIATTWLPLIVTMAVLVIILGMIIRGFGGNVGAR